MGCPNGSHMNPLPAHHLIAFIKSQQNRGTRPKESRQRAKKETMILLDTDKPTCWTRSATLSATSRTPPRQPATTGNHRYRERQTAGQGAQPTPPAHQRNNETSAAATTHQQYVTGVIPVKPPRFASASLKGTEGSKEKD